VTNFDVIADELPGREYVLSEEYNGKQHIGNNRFNVLLDIHYESFSTNSTANNQKECDKIVGIIWDATCGNRDRQDCVPGGDCDKYRGRFLVKHLAAFSDTNLNDFDSNVDWKWKELDEKSCKRLIVQALIARKEEKTKDLFEPIDILSDLNSGTGNRHSSGFRVPRLRRSRSASNIMLDAKNALGEIPNYDEIEEEDPFEPLPITSSSNLHEVDLDLFGNLNHELNNRKKRERRRSLLRRSNSFESLFDRKKVFRNHGGVFPSSKRQPSFIRSHNYSITPETSPSVRSRNIVSSADNYAASFFPDVVSSSPNNVKPAESVVSTFQGMDVVLQSDCKTLNANSSIMGNNRLRILLTLESDRFNLLSSAEQQRTATDLLRTITEKWKGRVLTENGLSYSVLNNGDAKNAIHSLLLAGNNTGNRNRREAASLSPTPSSSYYKPSASSSPKPASSLLAAAPPLPDFLRDASKEILSQGRKKYSNQMSARERQAAAINALKERNKSRQLAKEKAKTTAD